MASISTHVLDTALGRPRRASRFICRHSSTVSGRWSARASPTPTVVCPRPRSRRRASGPASIRWCSRRAPTSSVCTARASARAAHDPPRTPELRAVPRARTEPHARGLLPMTDLSRRGLFGRLLGRSDAPARAPEVARSVAPTPGVAPTPSVAPKPSGRPKPGPMRPGRPGIFTVSEQHCIAWKGTSCSTCRERCPVPGALTVASGRPTIDPALCTGCGDRVAVCPAPILAIRFVATQVTP